MKVYCVFSLESPHGGDSKECTHYTIFNEKKKITLNYSESAAMGFFSWGLKKRVINSCCKWAISVWAFEVQLYMLHLLIITLLAVTAWNHSMQRLLGKNYQQTSFSHTPSPSPLLLLHSPCFTWKSALRFLFCYRASVDAVKKRPGSAGSRPGSAAGSRPGSAAGSRPGSAAGSRPSSSNQVQ